MGQVLQGSATTTEAVRRAIQKSQESLRVLAGRYGINPKTVAKWKKRGSVKDRPTGPKSPQSTALSLEREAVILASRCHTLLPLDDCLYALQAIIPHLIRSSWHRYLQRHGVSRLPNVDGDKPAKKKSKRYPIGCFDIDIAEVQTAEGKLRLLVAVDRTSKVAFARLEESATVHTTAAFLSALIEAVPYQIHTVVTDHGNEFCDLSSRRNDPTARLRVHRFDRVCFENGIEHELTVPNHPWIKRQAERMQRTIMDATVNRFHYDSHDHLRRHLQNVVDAYNFGRRLKALKGLTPYEFICRAWTKEPERFGFDPICHKYRD